MDISKIKITPKAEGGAVVELDTNLVERFKLFCLIDYYIGKAAPNWELKKIQSHPSGQLILYVQVESLTNIKNNP